ncbi:MAG TPA: sulfotransferase [Bacteroidales bacterium]|nr:sulfotransferase [Bacteroidales bacterium]
MEIPFFFILGRPRSGTTLLKTLFDAHPNVKIPPELPIFLPLYQKFRRVKRWDREHILSFVDHVFAPNVFNTRKIENLRIDRERFTADLLAMENQCTIQDLLIKLNEHTFSVFPKEDIRLVGDKNPVYSVYMRRLIRIFPKAWFVCIVRDYRDNFVSLKNLEQNLMEAPVLTLQIARWKYVTRLFLKFQDKYPERFYLVRYEDLVMKPEETVRELCAFLSIPYHPEVFEFHRKKEEVMEAFSDARIAAIHKSLMDPVNTGRMGLWQKQLTDLEVRIADQIAGHTADIMGYERKSRKFSLKVYLKSLPMQAYGLLLFRLMQWSSLLPYRSSRWIALNLPRLVRVYRRFSEKSALADQEKK